MPNLLKRKIRSTFLIKNISAVLTCALLLQDVGFAAPGLKPVLWNRDDASLSWAKKRLPSFPESVVTIEDAYRAPGSDKTLILMQDAHTNDSGQFNLARTLDLLLRKDPMKYVFLEAGTGDVSLAFLKKYSPSPGQRQQAAASLVRRGELQGSEYLNLVSDRDFVLWGVEDQSLYTQSLTAYRDVVRAREKFQQYLNKVASTIEVLKPNVLNPFLLAFDEKHEKYQNEEISVTDYFEILLREARRLDLSLYDYPHLKALQKLKALESRIDFRKAAEQQEQILRTLPEKDREELRQAADHPTASKITSKDNSSQKAYFTLLEEMGSDELKNYPSLFVYLQYLKESKKIDIARILDEQKILEKEIYRSLAATPEEALLVRASANIRLLKKLLNLTLTPAEYEDFRKNARDFNITRIAGFLNKKIKDLNKYYEKALFLETGYEDAVSRCETFYNLTYQRDQAFVATFLAKMAQTDEREAVLITGGYHSPNLKHLLKEKGISYICLTPQVLHDTDQNRYERILLSQRMDLPAPNLPKLRPAPLPGATTNTRPIMTEAALSLVSGGGLANQAENFLKTVTTSETISPAQVDFRRHARDGYQGISSAESLAGARLANSDFDPQKIKAGDDPLRIFLRNSGTDWMMSFENSADRLIYADFFNGFLSGEWIHIHVKKDTSEYLRQVLSRIPKQLPVDLFLESLVFGLQAYRGDVNAQTFLRRLGWSVPDYFDTPDIGIGINRFYLQGRYQTYPEAFDAESGTAPHLEIASGPATWRYLDEMRSVQAPFIFNDISYFIEGLANRAVHDGGLANKVRFVRGDVNHLDSFLAGERFRSVRLSNVLAYVSDFDMDRVAQYLSRSVENRIYYENLPLDESAVSFDRFMAAQFATALGKDWELTTHDVSEDVFVDRDGKRVSLNRRRQSYVFSRVGARLAQERFADAFGSWFEKAVIWTAEIFWKSKAAQLKKKRTLRFFLAGRLKYETGFHFLPGGRHQGLDTDAEKLAEPILRSDSGFVGIETSDLRVLARLKRINPDKPILFIATQRPDLALAAVRAGADAVLLKSDRSDRIREIREHSPESVIFAEIAFEKRPSPIIAIEREDVMIGAGADALLIKPYRIKVRDEWENRIPLTLIRLIASARPDQPIGIAGGITQDNLSEFAGLPNNVVPFVASNPPAGARLSKAVDQAVETVTRLRNQVVGFQRDFETHAPTRANADRAELSLGGLENLANILDEAERACFDFLFKTKARENEYHNAVNLTERILALAKKLRGEFREAAPVERKTLWRFYRNFDAAIKSLNRMTGGNSELLRTRPVRPSPSPVQGQAPRDPNVASYVQRLIQTAVKRHAHRLSIGRILENGEMVGRLVAREGDGDKVETFAADLVEPVAAQLQTLGTFRSLSGGAVKTGVIKHVTAEGRTIELDVRISHRKTGEIMIRMSFNELNGSRLAASAEMNYQKERILRTIQTMAEQNRRGDEVVEITHRTLASELGLSRSALAKIMASDADLNRAYRAVTFTKYQVRIWNAIVEIDRQNQLAAKPGSGVLEYSPLSRERIAALSGVALGSVPVHLRKNPIHGRLEQARVTLRALLRDRTDFNPDKVRHLSKHEISSSRKSDHALRLFRGLLNEPARVSSRLKSASLARMAGLSQDALEFRMKNHPIFKSVVHDLLRTARENRIREHLRHRREMASLARFDAIEKKIDNLLGSQTLPAKSDAFYKGLWSLHGQAETIHQSLPKRIVEARGIRRRLDLLESRILESLDLASAGARLAEKGQDLKALADFSALIKFFESVANKNRLQFVYVGPYEDAHYRFLENDEVQYGVAIIPASGNDGAVVRFDKFVEGNPRQRLLFEREKLTAEDKASLRGLITQLRKLKSDKLSELYPDEIKAFIAKLSQTFPSVGIDLNAAIPSFYPGPNSVTEVDIKSVAAHLQGSDLFDKLVYASAHDTDGELKIFPAKYPVHTPNLDLSSTTRGVMREDWVQHLADLRRANSSGPVQLNRSNPVVLKKIVLYASNDPDQIFQSIVTASGGEANVPLAKSAYPFPDGTLALNVGHDPAVVLDELDRILVGVSAARLAERKAGIGREMPDDFLTQVGGMLAEEFEGRLPFMADDHKHFDIYFVKKRRQGESDALIVINTRTKRRVMIDLSKRTVEALRGANRSGVSSQATRITDQVMNLREKNSVAAQVKAEPTTKVVWVDGDKDGGWEAGALESLIEHSGPTLEEGSKIVFVSVDPGRAVRAMQLAQKLAAADRRGRFLAMSIEDARKLQGRVSYLLKKNQFERVEHHFGAGKNYLILQSPEDPRMAGLYAFAPTLALMDLVALGQWDAAAELYNRFFKAAAAEPVSPAWLKDHFDQNLPLPVPFVAQLLSDLVARIYMAERFIARSA